MAAVQAPMQVSTRQAHHPQAQLPNYGKGVQTQTFQNNFTQYQTMTPSGGKNPYYGVKLIQGRSYKRAPDIMNVPYGATTMDSWDPTGYLYGDFPPNHMIMPNPPSQRNSAFHARRSYGKKQTSQ